MTPYEIAPSGQEARYVHVLLVHLYIAFHPFILVQYITEVGLQNSAENAASFYFIQLNEKEKYETKVEELFDQNSIFFT